MNAVVIQNPKIDGLNLDTVRIDPQWALRLPAQYALRKRVLPLSMIDQRVTVACLNSNDIQVQQTVEKYLKQACKLIHAEPASLKRALERVYQQVSLGQLDDVADIPGSDNSENPVQICNSLIQAAILRGASDLHLVPGEMSLAVHLRVDGQLEPYTEIPKQLQPGVTSRLKVIAGMDIAEKRAAQDGRITAYYGTDNCKLEMRAASLPTRYGERITLRLLANGSTNTTLRTLGMNESDLATFQAATNRPHGLILLTGPTGSGKSTTLYAAIEHLLQNRGGNVITIEDPVEYEIPGASQVEVDSVDKVNFSKALRSVLRHDPDVLMIGEIRDSETADTAIKAALTGHLVLSTLHTNTATGVVTRLIDMGVEPFLIAEVLRLSVAQRLVRRLCPVCRSGRLLQSNEATLLQAPDLAGKFVYEPVGCIECAGKGFAGRIGLFEMFENDPTISKLIADSSTESLIAAAALRQGCRTLLQDGIGKVLDGITTVGEIASAIAME